VLPRKEVAMAKDESKQGISRRALIGGAGAVAGSAGLLAGCKYGTQLFLLRSAPSAEETQATWAESRVQSYRELGRTGFRISDISFGCSGLDDPNVVRRAIEKGINYFDTSPDYSNELSERSLGEGIKGTPRDKLFIASKFCTSGGHLANDTPVADVIAAVEGSLTRLQTDYLDLAHIHAVNSIDRLMAPNLHEAFDRLKEQGKVRHLGVSSHTPDLETVMRHAVDNGRFDVIMVAYNFHNWPGLTEIFAEAHRKRVGVVAMKTLKGAHHTKLAGFTPTERETFAQAAFKWVLSNSDVDGLVVTMDRLNLVDEYLVASGQPVTPDDVALLEKYDSLTTRDYCRPGCGDCLDACPHGVPVNDVMRYAMYYENYHQQKEAMRLYAKVDPARAADHCAGCSAPCESSCSYGIPIRNKLALADRTLRLFA